MTGKITVQVCQVLVCNLEFSAFQLWRSSCNPDNLSHLAPSLQ